MAQYLSYIIHCIGKITNDPTLLYTFLPHKLYPALGIPFVEFVPDLCLGWWSPPNLNLKNYEKMAPLRVVLQGVAWYPVFEMLLPITTDTSNYSLLVLSATIAIVTRPFLLKKLYANVTSTPLWKNKSLTSKERQALFVVISSQRPSDINNFDDMCLRYVNFPTKVAGAVMCGIVGMLHPHLSNQDQMMLKSALAAFVVGGVGIGAARHGMGRRGFLVDVMFRILFAVGFVGILFYLSEVSDLVLTRGLYSEEEQKEDEEYRKRAERRSRDWRKESRE